ncbi:hypothetical protein HY085_00470 [Candidatus Gottesmanbacteria bacterium]|nr:hypothetical protein [Candidatus Gottesmanbacteria bacterium]
MKEKNLIDNRAGKFDTINNMSARQIFLTNTDIRPFIHEQKKFYKNLVSIHCPILGDSVYFTASGFNHLLYTRNVGERFLKLQCLTLAPEVIKKCVLISETRQTEKAVHYELVHEVSKNKKIRVIIEKIGSGKYRFLSVMFHDRKSKKMCQSLDLDISSSKKGLRPTSTKA